MDLVKIDNALCAFLESEAQASDPVSVFVCTQGEMESKECEVLRSFGVRNATPHKKMYTARLTASNIRQLSTMPWVAQLCLAQKLKPLLH